MGSNPSFIKQMITYVIQEPDLSRNPKFFQKFPFNASEIFFLELEDVINAFFVESSMEASRQERKSILEDSQPIGGGQGEELENPDMMEKCIGYFSKLDRVSSPKKKGASNNKHDEPEIEENMMDHKFSPFKPLDNGHFDITHYNSHQSIVYSEKPGVFELLDHLFSFLENAEKQLNLTMAGYFAKVTHSLLNKRFMDVGRNFFIIKGTFS